MYKNKTKLNRERFIMVVRYMLCFFLVYGGTLNYNVDEIGDDSNYQDRTMQKQRRYANKRRLLTNRCRFPL